MELANAIYKIDMLVDDQGRTAEKEAWNNIRAYIAEVQKPAHNTQSHAISLCLGCIKEPCSQRSELQSCPVTVCAMRQAKHAGI